MASGASTWVAMYRRTFNNVGEPVTLRRGTTDISVLARVTGHNNQELELGVVQSDCMVLVLAEDVTFAPPLKRGDKVVVRGRVLTIEDVDDNTRRVAGVLVAYQLRARG